MGARSLRGSADRGGIGSRHGSAGRDGQGLRARDSRLNRKVAIKFLYRTPSTIPSLARFGRETQLPASLNHPRIAQIYGLEEASGLQALVMELVERPTLAERIGTGPSASTRRWGCRSRSPKRSRRRTTKGSFIGT